jgi:hypothetical protein
VKGPDGELRVNDRPSKASYRSALFYDMVVGDRPRRGVDGDIGEDLIRVRGGVIREYKTLVPVETSL